MKSMGLGRWITAAVVAVSLTGAGKAVASDICENSAGITTVAPQVMKDYVRGNTQFALDLYQQLEDEKGNLFFSPYSITTAFGMVYGGAAGSTELALADGMNLDLSGEDVHRAAFSLLGELNCRANAAYELKTASAVWGQTGYGFRDSYLTLVDRYYGAGVQRTDFRQAPEKARVEVNDWVEGQTNGRIEDLIPRNALTPLTRMVLANAIYYKGSWVHPFAERLTAEREFHLSADQSIDVPMMRQEQTYRYYEDAGLEAVQIPILAEDRTTRSQQSMLMLIPKNVNGLEALTRSLDAERLHDIHMDLKPQRVELTLPKFSFTSELSLKEKMAALGMGEAFDSQRADFSAMYQPGEEPLYISDAFHKAFVDVHEKGIEAAAATGVVFGTTSAPPPPVPVTADRPFLFFIMDEPTDTVLFMGRVVDPR